MKNEIQRRAVKPGRFSTACLEKWHDLKERVTANLAAEFAGVLNLNAVRRVMNEADALASITPFPALFLPVLAEEKAHVASDWGARQRLIRFRSMDNRSAINQKLNSRKG